MKAFKATGIIRRFPLSTSIAMVKNFVTPLKSGLILILLT